MYIFGIFKLKIAKNVHFLPKIFQKIHFLSIFKQKILRKSTFLNIFKQKLSKKAKKLPLFTDF